MAAPSVLTEMLTEDSSCLLPSDAELRTLSDDEVKILERATMLVVGLRFEAERRRRRVERAVGSRRDMVPYDGDPNLAPVPDDEVET